MNEHDKAKAEATERRGKVRHGRPTKEWTRYQIAALRKDLEECEERDRKRIEKRLRWLEKRG